MAPIIQRVIFVLVILGGLLFAIQGGEYSTMEDRKSVV